MKKLFTILFLSLCATTYSQTFYYPVVIKQTLRVDGKVAIGGVTFDRDFTVTADTIRIKNLDGTGTILGIDVNGDVTRVTGVGAAGVTGLNDYEPLFGSLTGTIEQDNFWYYDPTTQFMRLGDPAGTAGGEIYVVNGTTGSYMTPTSVGVTGSVGQTYMDGQYFNLYDLDGEFFSIGRATWSADEVLLFPAAKGALNQSLYVSNVSGDNVTFSWFTPAAGTVTSFSATDGNGFDFTVTNPTTTPTLTLTTTVSDNQVFVSNSGALSGSSLFTYDNTTNNEHFDVTVLEFDVVGTSSYPFSLFNISDNGNVSICDFNGNFNGTYAIFDDPSESITLSANNGITVNQFSGLGQNLIYSNNSGTLGLATLSDFTLSAGALSITSGAIVNADINSSAAIAQTKMAAMTASKAVVTDGSGFETTSSTTSTEIGYVAGVTSAIQTQLDARSKVVATSHLTSQNAAIAATTLYAVPADGFYTITVQLAVTTTGGTSIGTQIRFTNVADNVVKTLPSNNGNGLNQCASTTAANAVCYTITAYCKSGANIQYITNLAGSGQVYSLVVKD